MFYYNCIYISITGEVMAQMNFRCSEWQKAAIEAKAAGSGFDSVGAYIKFVAINSTISVKVTTNDENRPDSKIIRYAESLKSVYFDFIAVPSDENATALTDSIRKLHEVIQDDHLLSAAFKTATSMMDTRVSDPRKAIYYKSIKDEIFKIIDGISGH